MIRHSRASSLLKNLSLHSPVAPGLHLEDVPATLQFPPRPTDGDRQLERDQPWLQVSSGMPRPWASLGDLYALTRVMYPPQVRHVHSKRLRFLFRTLSHFSLWQQWRQFLETSPLGEIAAHFPRLYEKPFRPYLHKDLIRAECHRVLREHYLFLQHHAPGMLVEALLNNRPFLLNEHSAGDLAEPLLLNFTYARHMQQEGELTLSIGWPDSLDTLHDHRWICSLTFLLQYGASGWEILVGGVQGGHSERSKEDIKTATHIFHGLRPKHLLIHLLREIAAVWGVSRIYAITDGAHCLKRARYRGRIKIVSSYDELWQDAGGHPAANGFYSLPVQQHHRSIEDVPSRKRSQYRKRYALMDSIDAEIREKLTLTATK